MKKILFILICLMIIFPGCISTGQKEGDAEFTISSGLQCPVKITFSGHKEELGPDESMTVTAETSEPVDSYQWHLDGTPLPGETGASITIGPGLEPRTYLLALVVTKDNTPSSNEITFKKEAEIPDLGYEGTWRLTEYCVEKEGEGIVFHVTCPYEYEGEIYQPYLQLKGNQAKTFRRETSENYSVVRLSQSTTYYVEGNKIIFANVLYDYGEELTYVMTDDGDGIHFTATIAGEEEVYHLSVKAVRGSDSEVGGAIPIE